MIVTVSFSDQTVDVKLDLLWLRRLRWNVCPTAFAQIHALLTPLFAVSSLGHHRALRVPAFPVCPAAVHRADRGSGGAK